MTGKEDAALGAELEDELRVEGDSPLGAAVDLDAEIAPRRITAVVVADLPERPRAIRIDDVGRRLREDDSALQIEVPKRTHDDGRVHVGRAGDAAVRRQELGARRSATDEVRVLREGRRARGLPGHHVIEEDEPDPEIRVHHEASGGAVVRVRVAGRVADAERSGDVGIAILLVRFVRDAEAERGSEGAHLLVVAAPRLGLGAVDARRPPRARRFGLAERPRARARHLRREASAHVEEARVEPLGERRELVERHAIARLVARREDGGELVRLVAEDDSAEPLPGVVSVFELREGVAEDEIAGDEHGELRCATERACREENTLGDVAAAIIAKERGVIAVVRDHPHSEVVRLLADLEEADLRPDVDVEPARVEIDGVRLRHRIARRIDVARRVAEEPARHVDLGDELDDVEELEARREAEPMGDHAPLPERRRAGILRRREERHVALDRRAKLVFAVDLEPNRVALRLLRRDAAGLEIEPREERARFVRRSEPGGAEHEERGGGEERAHVVGSAQHR